jgi:hypothetical protein
MAYEPRQIPTAYQKRQAEAAQAPTKDLVVTTGAKVPALTPAANYRDRYLSEIAPASIVGTMVKFGKDGTFIRQDTEKAISEDEDFLALCDSETQVGYVKFNGAGEPPDREMGLFYDGFVMPARESLGDLDESKWEKGLDGQPQDPWQHQVYLVLQHAGTKEMFTYITGSKTGRRAVGTLLRHYDRLCKTKPGHVPVVRLRSGSFNHKDSRIGWVSTPVFTVMCTAPRDEALAPDTSTEAILNDALPDNMR